MLDWESELEVIGTAIATASTGSGSALVVEGVAGIGKTRLLAQGCTLGQRAACTG
jgi:predicted ATPase